MPFGHGDGLQVEHVGVERPSSAVAATAAVLERKMRLDRRKTGTSPPATKHGRRRKGPSQAAAPLASPPPRTAASARAAAAATPSRAGRSRESGNPQTPGRHSGALRRRRTTAASHALEEPYRSGAEQGQEKSSRPPGRSQTAEPRPAGLWTRTVSERRAGFELLVAGVDFLRASSVRKRSTPNFSQQKLPITEP